MGKSVTDRRLPPGKNMDAMSSREYKAWLRATMRSLRGSRTQQNIADALQVPLDRYIKWEHRGSLPSEFHKALAAIYEMSLDAFAAYKPPPETAELKPGRGRPRRAAGAQRRTAA